MAPSRGPAPAGSDGRDRSDDLSAGAEGRRPHRRWGRAARGLHSGMTSRSAGGLLARQRAVSAGLGNSAFPVHQDVDVIDMPLNDLQESRATRGPTCRDITSDPLHGSGPSSPSRSMSTSSIGANVCFWHNADASLCRSFRHSAVRVVRRAESEPSCCPHRRRSRRNLEEVPMRCRASCSPSSKPRRAQSICRRVAKAFLTGRAGVRDGPPV